MGTSAMGSHRVNKGVCYENFWTQCVGFFCGPVFHSAFLRDECLCPMERIWRLAHGTWNDGWMGHGMVWRNLYAYILGFSHFGIVNGVENVKEVLLDHELFMKEFRAQIIKYYNEKDETRYICEKVTPFLLSRSDLFGDQNMVLGNMVLQAVYGVMMDLGYRDG